jgi:hypothetical protein
MLYQTFLAGVTPLEIEHSEPEKVARVLIVPLLFQFR